MAYSIFCYKSNECFSTHAKDATNSYVKNTHTNNKIENKLNTVITNLTNSHSLTVSRTSIMVRLLAYMSCLHANFVQLKKMIKNSTIHYIR